VLALVLALWVGQVQRPSDGPDVPIAPVLDDYANGDDRLVDDRLRALVAASGRPRVALVRSALERDAKAWIQRHPENARDRARLIVAAVALEAANLGGLDDWPNARALIEWACALIRANRQRLEAERVWHWGAIAVLESAADAAPLQVHATHALGRFADDARFVLARAVASELRTWPDEREGRTAAERNPEAVALAVDRLNAAAALPDVRAEALMRLGCLALRNNHPSQALSYLRDATAARPDPFVRHLIGLFQGRALERLERVEDAMAAYRSALDAHPGQTASLALASVLLRTGRRREAAATADAATRAETNAGDPWTAYGRADGRFWSDISARLRRELR
jgi:tetratricopeptide (TPR) repeat protein